MISDKTKFASMLLAAVFLASVVLPSCCQARQRKIVESTKFLMGTDVHIKVSIEEKEDEARARLAVNKAFEEVERVENIFSTYIRSSEISRINKLRKNERLQISHEAFNLIKKSIAFSRITDGAFDITVKPLVDLWQIAEKDKKLPNDEDIKLALAHTGYDKVMLDDTACTIAFKKEDMALDLGGVAKGYATDRAIKILKENGVNNAIVASGGNLYCLGRKLDNEFWTAAIQHPRNKDRIFMKIGLHNKAVDTSGDYEKYFILDNRRYSHIIDPRTGYPIGDSTISSTVIADEATISDILATSLMILGQKGLNITESIKGVDAIVVFKRNDKFIVKRTERISERYAIKEEKL